MRRAAAFPGWVARCARSALPIPVVLLLLLAWSASPAQTRLAIPSYQDPGSSEWNAWAAPGRASIGIMIVNEDNGDDTTYHPAVAAAIAKARANGIFVVGYVYTGYGRRDPAVVRNRVDAVYANYLVDGIFFDEAPTGCLTPNSFGGTDYSHYLELSEYVRTREAGARLVILNPGTQPVDDCWMSVANILVTAESSSLADFRDNYQDQAWFHRYPPERIWHIVYNAPGTDQLAEIMALSQARGAGWLYATDLGGDNPYAGPPAYWATETSRVADGELQSLYADARPASTGASGNAIAAKISFRFTSRRGASWQIFVSNEQRPIAGAGAATLADGLAIDPRERIDVDADGTVRVYSRSAKSGWILVHVQAVAYTLQALTHVVELDSAGLGAAGEYQVRSLDAGGTPLATSLPGPVNVLNTRYVFDVANH